MKLWSSNFTFNAPWSKTTEAVWKKYPNDQMPNVSHIDVIDRKVTHDGRLQTTRLIGSHFNFPELITSMLGLPEMCYAIEFSEVDLKTQKMTLRTINSTFDSVLSVNEKLVYTPSSDDLNRTHLKQSAKVHVNGIPFTSYFENLLVNGFEATSKLGRTAMQNVLNKITIENILNTVTDELHQLSHDIDTAASKFNIADRISEISKDLDRASSIIDTEVQLFSNKLHYELVQLLQSLDTEITNISVKVNLSGHCSELESSKIGLFEAVMKAGISIESENY